MELHLNPELQARVDRAAKENNRGPAEYVRQLIEHYVD
ncbi:DNA-binding protein, partial [Pseudomonas sp. GW460-R15]